MKKTKAWAPGHITGFFAPYLRNNWRKTGSTGAGINLQKGIEATAKIEESNKTKINVRGISKYAIKELVNKIEKEYKIEIEFKKEIPTGYGLGASASEAISSLLATNKALEKKFTQNKLLDIAHMIEVKKRTGLGDVIAQSNGGLVIRKKEGDIEHSEIDKIPTKEKKVYIYLLDKIETPDILDNERKKKKIKKSGLEKRKNLLKKPIIENFFKQSKQFALQTGLAKGEIGEILKNTKKPATMTMLGKGIFSLKPITNIEPKKMLETKISQKGSVLE